ncbi:MAG: TonB-dependent receptor [Bacteroidota bacterium]
MESRFYRACVSVMLVGLMLVSVGAWAQGTAIISGKIKDANGTLPGASIMVKGTEAGAITDLNGDFRIIGLEAGKITLQISFIGYETEEFTAVAKANERVVLETIELSESITELKEVVIKGSFIPSQIRAYSIQKEASNIQNVIAADAIGKLPDRNAAEAVQRIPGVSIERDQGEGRFALVRGTPSQWNANLVNGDRLPSTDGFSGTRQTALDVIPSELIEYAIVSKALTPDMEGDAIGGSINFLTRRAPESRLLNVSLAGGYNDQIQNGNYNGSVIYGDRIGEKFGFLLSAAVWNRPWASDNYEMEYNFDLPGDQGFSVNQQELRDYEGVRNTVGLNLSAQYDINENNNIYVRGLYDVFSDYEFAREHIFTFPEGPDEDPNEGDASLRARTAGFLTTLYGGEIGGEHNINSKLSLDWKASTYSADVTFGNNIGTIPQDQSGIQLVQFAQGGAFTNVSNDNFMYWNFDSPNGVGGGNAGDPFQPNFEGSLTPQAMVNSLAGVFRGESNEADLVGQFNLKYEANEKLKFKFGGKYRNKRREAINQTNFYIPLALFGAPTPLTFYSDQEVEPYDVKGGFLQELGQPYDNLLLAETITPAAIDVLTQDVFDNLELYFPFTSAPNELSGYNGVENVIAAYAMGEYEFSNELSMLAGLRYEQTSVSIEGFEQDTSGTLNAINETSTYGALLPAVHFKYTPVNNLNVRLAYTRSFARPNFSDLNPNRVVSDIGGGITQISGGNPDLNPTFSNNFDLLGEYYFKDVGIISAGVFYKSLTDLIFNNLSQETIDGQLVRLSEPRNLKSASLLGFELAFSKRFTFLPGALGGLGVDANYTYTTSEVEVPTFNPATLEESTSIQTLIGQPKNIFNFVLFYEKYGLTARLAANFKGAYIDEYRIEAGPEHYRYYDQNLTIDFSASYAIKSNIRVFVEVNNLTNEPLRYYHGVTERPEQTEFYSIRGQAGVRFTLK